MTRYIDMDKLTARLPVVGVDGTDPLVSVAERRWTERLSPRTNNILPKKGLK